MRALKIVFIVLLGLLIIQSCEKTIDVDLEEAPPQIVIEAPLQVGTNDFTVSILKSTDYFGNQPQEIVENAIVTLRNNIGLEINIPYSGNGQYITEITAMEGLTYTLGIIAEGQTYEATSFLPDKIEIVELVTEFQSAGIIDDEGYELLIRYEDPAEVSNYYRVIHSLNGLLQDEASDLQVMNDDFNNGVLTRAPLLTDIFNEGDTIKIDLIHFDRASFDYFNSLVGIIGEGDGFGAGIAAPGNPNTNWSGGALGYFSAFNIDSEITIAQ